MSDYSFNSEDKVIELFSQDNIIYTVHSVDKKTIQLQKSFIQKLAFWRPLLKNVENMPIKESKSYKIKGEGFSTEEDAYNAGVAAINAVYWFGLKERIGVKLKEYSGGFTKYARDNIEKESGIKVLDTTNLYKKCLIVKEEEDKFTVPEISVSLSVLKPIERFQSSFQEGTNLIYPEKIQLAMELYHASHQEVSRRAKFLTEMMIVESLIIQKKKNNSIIQYISSLIDETKNAPLEQSDKESLQNGLYRLKFESIKSAGKSLVQEHIVDTEYNGKSAEEFFKECYNARSNMLHGNVEHDEMQEILARIANEFDKMVSDLIMAHMKLEG